MREQFKNSIKNIKSNRPLVSVQDIVNFIDKGEKYLKLSIDEIDEMEIFTRNSYESWLSTYI